MASAPADAAETRTRIREILEDFVEAFNVNDLDRVMPFFAEDAVFCPGDGNEHRGKAAIRKSFEPQFRGFFGKMYFAVDDWIIDEAQLKATIRWICHHDIAGDKGRGMPAPLRWAIRAVLGEQAGWYGLDVFHFDEDLKIEAKLSYGHGIFPRLRRDLGRPL